MRYVIEVEETVKVHHQIVVESSHESQVETALDNVDEYCVSLDDFVDAISDVIPVIEVNEEFMCETQEVEYYDDYYED